MNKSAVKEARITKSQRPGSKMLNNLFSNYIDDKVNPSVATGEDVSALMKKHNME